jgi:hypothetical protein
MAESSISLSADELNALADRLAHHADGIVNAAAHQMAKDIRLAASVLRQVTRPAPRALLPALRFELENAAEACADATTARYLRQLIGDG